MVPNWGVFVLTAGLLGLLAVIVVFLVRFMPWRRKVLLERAQGSFHQQREWLEARFLKLASQSGKPRGMRWVDCDFEDEVSFARDRNSGRLRALVGVTIQFEAIEGGGMESVEAVQTKKAATVLFRLDGPKWEPDARAYFNLNPSQIIANYPHELEQVSPRP